MPISLIACFFTSSEEMAGNRELCSCSGITWNLISCFNDDQEQQQSKRNVQELIQQLRPELENGSSSQIEILIIFINKQIKLIQGNVVHKRGVYTVQAQDRSGNSSVTDLAESVNSSIDVASQILNKVYTELDKFQKTNMAKAMGDLTLQVVKEVGNAHWVMLGLSMVALVVQKWMVYKSIRADLIDTLKMMVYLATNVKKLWETMEEDRRKELQDAVQVIVNGALTCDAYCSQQNSLSRYLSPETVKDQLQKMQENIEKRISSLGLATSADTLAYVKKNIAETPEAKWPEKPQDFKSEGIDGQVEDVKQRLKMKHEDSVVAVALCGIEGIGKTHLAQSVIYSLKEDKEVSSKFKFCRVDVIKRGYRAESADIEKLQQRIVTSLSGKSQCLGDDAQDMISNTIKDKYCFIFINNLHDKNFLKHLLPESLGSNSSSDNTKVRILITCKESDIGRVMGVKCDVVEVKKLDFRASQSILLWRITEGRSGLKSDFNEYDLIGQVADECNGMPFLLKLIGDYLCEHRLKKGEGAYKNVLDALRRETIGELEEEFGDRTLSKTLKMVFDDLNANQKEALLDICTYYHGWDWMLVSCILSDSVLEKLEGKSLLSKDDNGDITVNDVILKMAREETKGNRIDEHEFSQIKRSNISDLKKVKGLVLSGKSFIGLKASELDDMSTSLRYLSIGGCVSIDKSCSNEFKELRFLSLEDLHGAPFQNRTRLPKLQFFHLASLDVMKSTVHEILRCPDLKVVAVDPSNLDSFFLMPTGQDVSKKSFKQKDVWRTVKKSKLQIVYLRPHITCYSLLDTSFHGDMTRLSLFNFQRVPQLNNLTNLTTLSLRDCTIEALPRVTSGLRVLDLRGCIKLKSLQFSPFPKLEYLDLEGCIKLEELKDEMQTLKALKFLKLSWCTNLKRLPGTFANLRSLSYLSLTGCIRLEKLPSSFAELPLTSFKFEELHSLTSLPDTIGKMESLEYIEIVSCKSIKTLPDEFVLLKALKILVIKKCGRLVSLPKNFNKLSSLEILHVNGCASLKELPSCFEALPVLKILVIESCKNMLELPKSFRKLVSLNALCLMNLPIRSLPVFGQPSQPKNIVVIRCHKLEEFSKDMISDSIYTITLKHCPSLPSAVLDWLLERPRCVEINITDSQHLLQRWKQLKNNTDSPTLVIESTKQRDWLQYSEWQRAVKTVLLNGPYVEGSCKTVIENHENHNSLPVEDCNSVALLCITDTKNSDDIPNFPFLTSDDGGLLTVFFKGSAENETETEEAMTEMDKFILKFMEKCPTRAVAIRTREVKRRLCLEHLFFDMWGERYLNANGAACILTHLKNEDDGAVKFAKPEEEKERKENTDNESSDSEDDSLGQRLQKMKSSDIERDRSNHDCDKTFLLNAMEKKNMHKLVDKDDRQAKVQDELSKTERFCLYESPLHMWNLILLNHLSRMMKMKMIWIVHFNQIPMQNDVKMGCGSYRRIIKNMQNCCWALSEPAEPLVARSKDNPIFLNSTLHFVDEKGEASEDFLRPAQFLESPVDVADICFVNNLVNQTQKDTEWRFLLGEKNFKAMLQGKLVFVVANPLERYINVWEEKLEQLWEATYHEHKYDIVHIGFPWKAGSAEREHASYQMHMDTRSTVPSNWNFLPYEDMVLLWWRILNSKRDPYEWVISLPGLVLLEDGNVVTRNAEYVVSKLMEEAGDRDDNDAVIKQELRESLKKGKCSAFVREFLAEDIVHPLHPEHKLGPVPFPRFPRVCDECGDLCEFGEDKVFGCKGCDFDLCEDCWKPHVFAQAKEAKKNEETEGAHPSG